LPGQLVPVLLAALLLAALAGAMATGQIKLPRPEVDLGPDRANGPIVVLSWTGQGLTSIDAEDSVSPDLELPAGSDLGDLTWAPDGQQMAYVEAGWVWIADVGDGSSAKLMPCAGQIYDCTIAWSPDNSRLAVAHAGKLELVNPSDASIATITEYAVNGVMQPTWSPDSSRLAFVVDPFGSAALHVINRDGSGDIVIHSGNRASIGIWDPAWAPDGGSIAYIGSDRLADDERWTLNVTVLEPDGSHAHVIAQVGRCWCLGFTPGLGWSPDGTKFALVVPGEDDEGGLYVMNADGSDMRAVGPGWGTPAWQPVP